MPRVGITYEQVASAADALVAESKKPTIQNVRDRLGTGSPNTIHRHLTSYRAAQAPTERPAPVLPQSIARAITDELERYAAASRAESEESAEEARTEAYALAETGEVLESERDEALEQLEALEAERNRLSGERDTLQAEVNRLTDDLEREREGAENARKDAAQAHARIEGLIEEREELKLSVSRAQEADKQWAVAQSQRDDAKRAADTLAQERDRAQEALDAERERQRSDLAAIRKEHKDEVAAIREEKRYTIDSLKSEVQRLRNQDEKRSPQARESWLQAAEAADVEATDVERGEDIEIRALTETICNRHDE